PSSDSEYDVGKDVPNIVPSTSKKSAGKKIPQNVAEVPIDKCEDVDLIKDAGLMKTVWGIGDCYDNPMSKEYQKVFVRGECVNFSPAIINKFLETSEEPQPEL
ncbi:envelope-like protein, partial [Trifolium medium]|nr:envelope-like protein [Trifolium medium]